MNPYRLMQIQHCIDEEIQSGDLKDLKTLQAYLEQELNTCKSAEEQKALQEANAKALEEYRRSVLPNIDFLITPMFYTFTSILGKSGLSYGAAYDLVHETGKDPVISRGNEKEDKFRDNYVFDLLSCTEEQILCIRGIGPKKLKILKSCLAQLGLTLGMNFTQEEIDILLDSVYDTTASNIKKADECFELRYFDSRGHRF